MIRYRRTAPPDPRSGPTEKKPREATEQRRDDERGFALAAAVLALVVVGALVTGGFYAASQESRISVATASAERAFSFAERGLHQGLSAYRRGDIEDYVLDVAVHLDSAALIPAIGEPVGSYDLWLRPLGPRLYFLTSTGRVVEGGAYNEAARTVGMLTRTMDPSFPMNRALQVNGDLTITGHSSIDGADNRPNNWSECDSLATQPGIVAQDTSLITKSGASQIDGDPPVTEDPTLGDEDYLDFGDIDFDELKSMATAPLSGTTYSQISPSVVNGVCDMGNEANWGAPLDPANPCHYYFPTIYFQGEHLDVSGVAGQGILLVEGDLKLSGGFEFYGIVIVTGTLESRGTGSHLNGVVLVGGGTLLETDSTVSNGGETSTSGNSIINFSSCAIERAEKYNRGTSRLVPIVDRAWIDLSAAGTTGTP